mgnify:CR=1 FL=1
MGSVPRTALEPAILVGDLVRAELASAKATKRGLLLVLAKGFEVEDGEYLLRVVARRPKLAVCLPVMRLADSPHVFAASRFVKLERGRSLFVVCPSTVAPFPFALRRVPDGRVALPLSWPTGIRLHYGEVVVGFVATVQKRYDFAVVEGKWPGEVVAEGALSPELPADKLEIARGELIWKPVPLP